jgi:hypothetical protein
MYMVMRCSCSGKISNLTRSENFLEMWTCFRAKDGDQVILGEKFWVY